MTVQELIEELKEYPPEELVYVFDTMYDPSLVLIVDYDSDFDNRLTIFP